MIVPRLLVSVASVTPPPPPPPPTLSGVTFGVGSYPGDGGGYFRVLFAIDNAVGGEYVEVLYDITAGDPITTTGVGGPAGPYSASPADVNVALGATPSAEATVNLYDAGAFLLDSVFLPDQPLPI